MAIGILNSLATQGIPNHLCPLLHDSSVGDVSSRKRVEKLGCLLIFQHRLGLKISDRNSLSQLATSNLSSASASKVAGPRSLVPSSPARFCPSAVGLLFGEEGGN